MKHLGWTISENIYGGYSATFDAYYSGESEYQVNGRTIEDIQEEIYEWYMSHSDDYLDYAMAAILNECAEIAQNMLRNLK